MLVRMPQHLRAVTTLAAAVVLAGCGPSSEADRLGSTGPISGPFYVSSYFSPSGHMGDGQQPGHVTALIGPDGIDARHEWCSRALADGVITSPDQCPDRPPGAGGDAYTFIYQPSTLLWAG